MLVGLKSRSLQTVWPLLQALGVLSVSLLSRLLVKIELLGQQNNNGCHWNHKVMIEMLTRCAGVYWLSYFNITTPVFCFTYASFIGVHGTLLRFDFWVEKPWQAKIFAGHRWDLNPGPCRQHFHLREKGQSYPFIGSSNRDTFAWFRWKLNSRDVHKLLQSNRNRQAYFYIILEYD